MSIKYSLPKNSDLIVSKVWLFLLITLSNLFLYYILFKDYIIYDEMMYGIMVLMGFSIIVTAVFFFVYFSRAILMYKFQKGGYYAAWIIKDKELEYLKKNEIKAIGISYFAVIFLSVLLIITGTIVYIIAYLDGQDIGIEYIIFILIIAVLLTVTIFIKNKLARYRANKEYYIAYLGKRGLSYNNILHPFNYLWEKLISLSTKKEGGLTLISLCYSTPYRGRRVHNIVNVPIPLEHKIDFQNIINDIVNDSNNEVINKKALNLIGKDCKMPLPLWLHIFSIIILGIITAFFIFLYV